jgi:multicomponent Na+:H+ antiporter subunit A
MFGTMITMIALAVLAEPGTKDVGKFYAENAYVKAKGKNIVNVILVDFRGLDTMVEITVLAIAALGVYGLMKLRMKDK